MDNNERIISEFLKPPAEGGAYTDEKLAALLAHAEDGKLSFASCCCLVGIPSADHALRDASGSYMLEPHYSLAKWGIPDWDLAQRLYLDGRIEPNENLLRAEVAFQNLAHTDEERRAKLIPLIHAEMSRRELLRTQVEVSEVVMA